MLRKIFLIGFLVFGLTLSALAQRTVVNDARAKTMLLGKHRLSLQWISWNYFGTAIVTNRGGVLSVKGEQKQRGGTDFVKINGTITEINAKDFRFDGTIITQVSHINGGKPCERTGEMTFKITGTRKYWRLTQMDNPCEGVTDYVDIFFR